MQKKLCKFCALFNDELGFVFVLLNFSYIDGIRCAHYSSLSSLYSINLNIYTVITLFFIRIASLLRAGRDELDFCNLYSVSRISSICLDINCFIYPFQIRRKPFITFQMIPLLMFIFYFIDSRTFLTRFWIHICKVVINNVQVCY